MAEIPAEYVLLQGDVFMGTNLFKKAAEAAIVIISFILAFLTYRGIDPEKFIKPDSTCGRHGHR